MMQSQLTLGQVSQGVECIVNDHKQKTQQNKIMEICLKQGCTQPNILCPLCKNLHNDHREKLVSIAEIEDEFRNAQQNNNNKFLLLINEFESFAKKQLEIMVTNMKLLVNPFNALESIIMNNKQQSYYQLNNQVSELVKLIEFENFKLKFKQPNQYEINIQINNLANQYLSDITNFMKQQGILKYPIQQSNTQRNDIKIIQQQQQQQQNNVVTGAQGLKINDFHFLQQDCGKYIKCVTKNCVRSIYGGGYSRIFINYIAFLNRSLQQSEGTSLVLWINSIKSINGFGIGISQLEKASKLDFDNYTIGQGIHLVYSDGLIQNNNYKEQISKFKIVEDQKYRFTFDPVNKENKQFQLEQVGNSVQQQLKIGKQNYYANEN